MVPVLARNAIDDFVANGFVRIEGAVAPDVVRACRGVIWSALGKQGIREHDPTTWTEPLASFPCPEGGPFVAAGTGPSLRRAYDELLGPGRWRRRKGVGGNLKIRFPSERNPMKTKWHIDGAFAVGDEWRNNVRCRGKGLLALFFFSGIGDADAPTQLLPGSHSHMARVLEPF